MYSVKDKEVVASRELLGNRILIVYKIGPIDRYPHMHEVEVHEMQLRPEGEFKDMGHFSFGRLNENPNYDKLLDHVEDQIALYNAAYGPLDQKPKGL